MVWDFETVDRAFIRPFDPPLPVGIDVRLFWPSRMQVTWKIS